MKELRSIGISPTCCCALQNPLPEQRRRLRCSRTWKNARSSPASTPTAAQDPDAAAEQGLDDIVVDKLRLVVPPADLTEWKQVVAAKANPDSQVDIAMVGNTCR